MKKIIFAAFIFILIGCYKQQQYVEPHPQPPVTDTEYCEAAQTNLENICNADKIKNKYCCDNVKPTLKGKTFKQFCETVQKDENIFLNPKCLSTLTSCDQIDVCTLTKKATNE